ncbi:MAG TPA: hypothetical protein VJ642_02245 [Chromobacteriaceae bacterium]|nr:hypothetical protein [Chromobacteriaceae bacterium]
MFYKVKLISPIIGVDFDGPLHPSEHHARQAATVLLSVHTAGVVIEIHKLLDLKLRKSEIVDRLEKPCGHAA